MEGKILCLYIQILCKAEAQVLAITKFKFVPIQIPDSFLLITK